MTQQSKFTGVLGADTADLYVYPLDGSTVQVPDGDDLAIQVGDEEGNNYGFHIQWILEPDSFYVFHGGISGDDGTTYEISVRNASGQALASTVVSANDSGYATYMTTARENMRLQVRRQGAHDSSWSASPALFRYDQPVTMAEQGEDDVFLNHATTILEAEGSNGNG